MKTLRALLPDALRICGCIVLVLVAFAAFRLSRLLEAVEQVAKDIPLSLTDQTSLTRAMALQSIAEVRRDLMSVVQSESAAWRLIIDEDLAALTSTADQRLERLTATADARLASLEGVADKHLTYLSQHTIAEVARGVDGVRKVTDPAGVVAMQFADAAPLFLDCDHNPDCAFNRFQGTSKSVERMAQAWEKASPVFISMTKQIGADADTLTVSAGNVSKNIERLTKPHWYDRAIGYGLNGAIMYRSLNPATNLTIKGAQIVTK